MGKFKKIISILILICLAFAIVPCWSMSTEEEVRIGKEASLQLEKKYKVLDDPKYQDRLERLGSYIVYTGLPRQDLTYHFKVIDESSINALTFPGGFIYATRGLMDKCTDGEVAFVMAHEIAHVSHYHILKRIDKSLTTQLGLLAIALILNKGAINPGTQNTMRIVSTIISSGYSRTDEREADISAIHYMAKAGIDPAYAILVFEKFRDSGSPLPGFLNTFIGSHPLPEERINYAKEEIAKIDFKLSENASIAAAAQNAGTIKDISGEGSQLEIIEADSHLPISLHDIEAYEDYKKIDYPSSPGRGKPLKVAEHCFYEFLKENFHDNLKYKDEAEKIARSFSGYCVQPAVFKDFILFADWVNSSEDFQQFTNRFKKEDLPYLKKFEHLIDSAGISIIEFENKDKQIIVIFEFGK